MAVSIDDFLSLRNNLPIVDVRSEGEYQSGHILHAINIPLLNNQERAQVGTDYKQRASWKPSKPAFGWLVRGCSISSTKLKKFLRQRDVGTLLARRDALE